MAGLMCLHNHYVGDNQMSSKTKSLSKLLQTWQDCFKNYKFKTNTKLFWNITCVIKDKVEPEIIKSSMLNLCKMEKVSDKCVIS